MKKKLIDITIGHSFAYDNTFKDDKDFIEKGMEQARDDLGIHLIRFLAYPENKNKMLFVSFDEEFQNNITWKQYTPRVRIQEFKQVFSRSAVDDTTA